MEYVSLLLAFGALLVAGWTAWETQQLRQIDRRRDAREDDERRQRQASGIAAWMCVADSAGSGKTWWCEVANDSGTPAYDVVVDVNTRAGSRPLQFPLLPPGSAFFKLGPESWDFGIRREELAYVPRPLTNSSSLAVTSMTFTDPAGIRWMRDAKGRLSVQASGAALLTPRGSDHVGST